MSTSINLFALDADFPGMHDTLTNAFVDITGPKHVDVSYSKDVVWVNVNGVCVFRACRVGLITVRKS